MTFRNCYYDVRKGMMHLWETISGERLYTEIPWTPYVYEKDRDGDIKTIDGVSVSKRTFQSFYDYLDYCNNESVGVYENRAKPEIQFLAERYYDIPDDQLEVPKLVTYSVDIEVNCDEGFPHAHTAEWPISVISVCDANKKRIITFGEKPYTGDMDILYVHCETEEVLLRKFFTFLYTHPCDVFTGWGIMNFDLPYLINRSDRIFGANKKMYALMSPIKSVRTWTSKKTGDMNIDIAGVHILDYFHVYKWYTDKKPENYKLGFISKLEIEKGKVDYSEYEDLQDLYKKNWNKYVEYNAIDAKRPAQLEDKLGYVRLIQALSLLTKCPMKFYASMTQLVEGAMLTYYRRNGMCAPYFEGGDQETFEAAIVKEPEVGMHPWVIDIDIASSYPSHVITLNMSLETFVGRILDMDDYDVVLCVRKKNFEKFKMLKGNKIVEFSGVKLKNFNRALERGIVTIAPCGSVFSTGKTGVMADIERFFFYKRQDVKKNMREETEEDKKNELFSLQWALKIFLNAIFGITAVPYSRYFNKNISEAITSCGRHTIKQGERFVNDLLNNPYQYEPMHKFLKEESNIKIDHVKYIDTDSLFVGLGGFLKTYGFDLDKIESETDKVEVILECAGVILDYVNERTFNETQLVDYNSQVHDFKIMFEQEIVADNALFIKKKKYSLHVVNDDGKPTDEIITKGLEIIRSETPEAIRPRLREIMNMILKKEDDDEIQEKIRRYRKELMNVLPEEISSNLTVNNIRKYIRSDGGFENKTPWHVKGVYYYRKILKDLKLENDYEDITEGEKGKVVYVKPNPFGAESITFIRWPKEFNEYLQIDYEKMIERLFLKKINTLLKPMNKESIVQSLDKKGLELFFGV